MHFLRLFRPACNCRQIYLSHTLPFYTGAFHRHFFSNTTIRSSHSSSEATIPVKPVKRRASRTKVDGVEIVKPVRVRRKRISKTQLTEADQAALSVSKLNLPPIDKWRQYFAIAEAQRLRTFLRHPDTAQMLAEAFVPEGSKDLIIIEAAPGMHSCSFHEVLVIQLSNRSWAVNKSTSQSSKGTNQEADCPRDA